MPSQLEVASHEVVAAIRDAMRLAGYHVAYSDFAGGLPALPAGTAGDCRVVRMRPGKTAAFLIRPVAVAGNLKIDDLRGHDGTRLAI